MENMPLKYKFIGFSDNEKRHFKVNPIKFNLHVILIEFNNGDNILNIEKFHSKAFEIIEKAHIYKNINIALKDEILERLEKLTLEFK